MEAGPGAAMAQGGEPADRIEVAGRAVITKRDQLGATAQESVPKLYAAGIVPGLLIAAMLGIYVAAYSWIKRIDRGAPFDLRRLLAGIRHGALALRVVSS